MARSGNVMNGLSFLPHPDPFVWEQEDTLDPTNPEEDRND